MVIYSVNTFCCTVTGGELNGSQANDEDLVLHFAGLKVPDIHNWSLIRFLFLSFSLLLFVFVSSSITLFRRIITRPRRGGDQWVAILPAQNIIIRKLLVFARCPVFVQEDCRNGLFTPPLLESGSMAPTDRSRK